METTTIGFLALLGLAAVIVVVIARQRTQLDIKKVTQSSLPTFSARCFKCGKQMEEGFVVMGGMSWRSSNSSPRKFSASGERLKNICSDQSLLIFSFGVPENRALRCSNCLLVVVDHSQLLVFKKSRTPGF